MTRPEYLPKSALVDGAHYAGHCRNATVARWDAMSERFVYRRHKFGHTFLEAICHPEDDQIWDVFYPEKMVHPTESETIVPTTDS